jgi:thiamine pyrophosphokinase
MKTLIISGGELQEEIFDTLNISSFQLIIAVDGGLATLHQMNLKVDVVVGDFDTVSKELIETYKEQGIEIENFNPEKNYTDTHLAVEKAIEKGATEIVIMGALGGRFDHTLANLHILMLPLKKGIRAKIIDATNRIQLVDQALEIEDVFGKYLSLLPLTTEVKGVTIKGVKYPLVNRTLSIGESIGVSNEALKAEKPHIQVKEGVLVVIQSIDR